MNLTECLTVEVFLTGMALAGVPQLFHSQINSVRGFEQPAPQSTGTFPGLILRERVPLNLEFPFATLDQRIVATNRFYVRNHFAIPKIDLSTWRLRIDGLVRQQLEFSYDELRKLPSRTLEATLECAETAGHF